MSISLEHIDGFLMDQVDTLHGGRYWSKVSCCTITIHMVDLEVKVMDLKILF